MHLYQPVKRSLELGFSLIEFMIAITISMIILLAVSIAWQSGLVTQKSQSDASRLNETVRFSIDLLSREFKQAGLLNPLGGAELPFGFATPLGAAIVGINDPIQIDPTTASIAGTSITVFNKSDAIRVRYYGDNPNEGKAGANGSGTESTYDCLGNLVPAGTLVSDTLYVAADSNNPSPGNPAGEPALWCYTSNGNTSQPMVSGVESLQILYGEDLPDPITGYYSGVINHYVPWQLVINPDHILSIKVSIIARSANAVSAGVAAGKIYYHFGTAASPYVDPTYGAATGPTQFTDPGDYRLRLPNPLSTEIARRNF